MNKRFDLSEASLLRRLACASMPAVEESTHSLHGSENSYHRSLTPRLVAVLRLQSVARLVVSRFLLRNSPSRQSCYGHEHNGRSQVRKDNYNDNNHGSRRTTSEQHEWCSKSPSS
jgi:hypothetical protein